MSEGKKIRRGLTRRRVLGTASLLPLAALAPDLLSESRAIAAGSAYRYFNTHQAAVIDAATRRIAPGPSDDILETGHPGAHECDVVRYIDTMLSMFDHRIPRLFAGGPWSNRHSAGRNHMKTFVMPDRAQAQAWRTRVKALQMTYRDGVKSLDAHADGDFTRASKFQQDLILAKSGVAAFTTVLFGHTIEGMYSNPEYDGNKGLAGWKEIDYPGDIQPRGYTAEEMAAIDVDVIDPTGIVALVLAEFPTVAQALASGVWRG
ncbi:MAG TPA: gluconate 2-dehydrogenase subunit 3 family protein [Mycobacteriales bacterium]|jgi:hypothetical protein|nr:gluconate 2-dehydrogenase subunit 3 family protein [Mycobacteriales bacterium]